MEGATLELISHTTSIPKWAYWFRLRQGGSIDAAAAPATSAPPGQPYCGLKGDIARDITSASGRLAQASAKLRVTAALISTRCRSSPIGRFAIRQEWPCTLNSPLRYWARHARRASLPLVVRGMTPAATSSTSDNGRLCRRDTAARMASTTGCRSARPAPGARSATMTRRSPASSAGAPGTWFAGTENAAT